MKKILLMTALFYSINSIAGGFGMKCVGELKSGDTISFTTSSIGSTGFTKISASGNYTEHMNWIKGGYLYDENSKYPIKLVFSNSSNQKARVIIKSFIRNESYHEEGGDPCNGGYAPGAEYIENSYNAIYFDYKSRRQKIKLTCDFEYWYTGSCMFDY